LTNFNLNLGLNNMTNKLFDDEGNPVSSGDKISFSFGIPVLYVEADVIERDGKLFALTPDLTPSECNLRSLRRYVGGWNKI